jgi:hypothetical protein
LALSNRWDLCGDWAFVSLYTLAPGDYSAIVKVRGHITTICP